MPSLPQDSPTAGLGTGFPMVRGPPSELMGFYVTTYEAAFGKRPTGSPQKFKEGRVLGIEPPRDRSIRPLLGVHSGSGYVVNNYSALRSLISPHVERQDTDISTTSEDFKIFGRPEYQRILPEHVDEPQCPYPTGFSFSRLRFGELDVGDGRMDSFSAICSTPQPAMGHPAPFAPPELQVGPKGVTTVKKPLSYGTVQNQHLIKLSQLAPIAPGWWAQTPITWAPRSVEGIQMPSPSGFSTNNRPTNLWRIDDPLT